MPGLQFSMYYMLVIVLPLCMLTLFVYASIYTDMWESYYTPWLLACVFNNLILSTFVNYRAFIPKVEEALDLIEKKRNEDE